MTDERRAPLEHRVQAARVHRPFGILLLTNAVILIGALGSWLVAAIVVIGAEAGALVLYAVALRATERELWAARLKMATIRPEEWAEAQRRQAAAAEAQRQAAIVQREGVYFPPASRGTLPGLQSLEDWRHSKLEPWG